MLVIPDVGLCKTLVVFQNSVTLRNEIKNENSNCFMVISVKVFSLGQQKIISG